MLMLERREGESFIISTSHGVITVVVADITGKKVKIGVAAPRDVPVYRDELWQQMQEGVPYGDGT